jgi:hypothetical protein
MNTAQQSVTESGLANQINSLDKAIKRTQDYLLRTQNEKGYWVGELEADASVAAGYIPLMYFMTERWTRPSKPK